MTATKEQLVAFMAAEFPQSRCEVETVGADRATVSRRIGPDDLRPGGTVSGPVLMAVADVACMWRSSAGSASSRWRSRPA